MKINYIFEMFSGLNTALITPFKSGKIDEKALEGLVELQVANGASGIVPCGTTGESPTLTNDEHIQVIKICTQVANKRIKIIAGTGSNSTAEAIEMTNHAAKIGVDASLSVAPYYNKPTKEGIFAHFKAINDNCDVPLIIYNIPGRSTINISDEEIAKLSELKNIVGVKDATGDLSRVATLKLLVDEEFSILSGEDATALGFNVMGGHGLISVTGNVAPKMVSDLQKASLSGDIKTAVQIQDKLTNLHSAMFCETSPIPAKYGAYLMGLCSNEIRLPLCQPSEIVKKRVERELKNLGLI
jgi:4-hydroxy-tetrahydrodipicolinate synthase